VNWDRINGFISEHILGLIQIYNVCGIKEDRAWDHFYDITFLNPVKTRHFSQFQRMWPHCGSRSSPFGEWWVAFSSYMAQMLDKTYDQMNNWRWDNPCACGNQIDGSHPQKTSSGKVKRAGERLSLYGSDDLRAKFEPPHCWQYTPGDFLAVRPLNWDEMIDEDDDDGNWADPCAPSGGGSRPGDGNGNDDRECEEDTRGGEKATGRRKGTKDGKGKGKATEDGKGKGKGKGTGNGKGKGTVEHTPGGDDISCAVALRLKKGMSEADVDTEG
jgi:hypothetical protein